MTEEKPEKQYRRAIQGDGLPWQRAEDVEEPDEDRSLRRRLDIRLYPDEYKRLQTYCKNRRTGMATIAREIVMAYLEKMEVRHEKEQR
jgi:hypothetical protein